MIILTLTDQSIIAQKFSLLTIVCQYTEIMWNTAMGHVVSLLINSIIPVATVSISTTIIPIKFLT